MDFATFVISGPTTATATTNVLFHGVPFSAATFVSASGINVNQRGQCLTDVFTISNSQVPPVCGTLSGEHGIQIHTEPALAPVC